MITTEFDTTKDKKLMKGQLKQKPQYLIPSKRLPHVRHVTTRRHK